MYHTITNLLWSPCVSVLRKCKWICFFWGSFYAQTENYYANNEVSLMLVKQPIDFRLIWIFMNEHKPADPHDLCPPDDNDRMMMGWRIISHSPAETPPRFVLVADDVPINNVFPPIRSYPTFHIPVCEHLIILFTSISSSLFRRLMEIWHENVLFFRRFSTCLVLHDLRVVSSRFPLPMDGLLAYISHLIRWHESKRFLIINNIF